MIKRIFVVSFLAMAMLVFISPVQAATVTGSSSGVFTNPEGPPGMVVYGAGTSNFSWGTGYGTPASALNFGGNFFTAETGELFSFGTLSYYNGSTVVGTEANRVDLSIQFSLIAPTGVTENVTYDLGLINTPNTGNPNASADYVNWANMNSSSYFEANGVTYELEFMGFGDIQGAGFTGRTSFHVLENNDASVQLVGRVNVVPIPATLLIFGSGLVGLVGWRRRKK